MIDKGAGPWSRLTELRPFGWGGRNLKGSGLTPAETRRKEMGGGKGPALCTHSFLTGSSSSREGRLQLVGAQEAGAPGPGGQRRQIQAPQPTFSSPCQPELSRNQTLAD